MKSGIESAIFSHVMNELKHVHLVTSYMDSDMLHKENYISLVDQDTLHITLNIVHIKYHITHKFAYSVNEITDVKCKIAHVVDGFEHVIFRCNMNTYLHTCVT